METIYNMDVMKALKMIPDETIDMQITSPPYWGLRDYGIGENQLGLEPSFEGYIKRLCDIFDEVKRVLKKDGTCWVNLGDTYYSGFGEDRFQQEATKTKPDYRKEIIKNKQLKPKCMVCIPERFALEMINRGWILRNKIIWHKPNHMPTSVKDRFANSWEYLFMFSKSKKYYFDLDAVREACIWADKDKRSELIRVQHKSGKSKLPEFQGGFNGVGYNPKGKNPDDVIQYAMQYQKGEPHDRRNELGKNPSDFWNITTCGYPEAHFAVFPEKLVERPIKTTRKDAIILDIFAGSGTTLKVARDLHRDSIGIEIKKDYCDLIIKRLTGGNQQLFNEIKVIK